MVVFVFLAFPGFYFWEKLYTGGFGGNISIPMNFVYPAPPTANFLKTWCILKLWYHMKPEKFHIFVHIYYDFIQGKPWLLNSW